MILKRKYIPFTDLYLTDEASRKVLQPWIEAPNSPKSEKERLWISLCESRLSVATAEIGCCIPNFEDIINEFEKLDVASPYDNGFTIADVKNVKLIGKEEDSVTIELSTQLEGLPYTVAIINVSLSANNQLSFSSNGDYAINVI